MNRIGASLVTALVVGSLSVSSAFAGCLDDVKKAGVLKSGNGLMGTKPFAWQNQDGSYAGFEWDLFQEIAKRMGVKAEYEITEWTTLIPGLKAGRWDIILSGMAVTQERIQGAGIQYSNPYFMLYDYIIVPEKSPIHSAADLKGKTISSTLGTMDSLNAHSLVEQGIAGKVLDFNDFGQPFVALQNGQVDAVILDQGTLIGQKETMKDLRAMGEPIYYHSKPEFAEAEKKASYILGGTAIGVRAECDDLRNALNTTLAALDADGTRQKILEKYGVWAPYQAKLMK